MLKAVEITAQMLEMRDFMRRLKGEQYLAWVGEARRVLRGLAKQRGISIAQAALAIAKQMDAAGHDPSVVICAFCEEASAE